MGIAVLGPLSIDGRSLAPRDRVVLAALTVRRGDVVDAAVLADALWREQPPATWSKQIQACVVRLRRALGPGSIETTAGGYRLVLPGDEIDVLRFERLVARAREVDALGAPERSTHLFGEALALWRGPALADLDGWAPGRIEAARLDELRLDVEEARLDAGLRAGCHRDLLAEAQARVAEQPLREHRWALLARAQYQSGRQGDALRTIRDARHCLAEELGLDPGPTLVALERAILRQDPSLTSAPPVPEPNATCPYQGLVPYDRNDAETFFGREVEVSECLRRLADDGVLVVAGPSGSGKSSLVRAGIAAALERDGRRVVVLTPGPHPLQELRVAGPSIASIALIVDQCEEAFTLCADVSERARFLEQLARHTGPLVVALRADRLGDAAAHPDFARLVERGLYLLEAMGEAGIRAAIEQPARRAGLLVEPGLADLLVREVEGEPGALPLLSHALAQTWANREGRTMTVAGYRASGGIRGAVARSAEHVYEQAAPHQRVVLRDLLLRLVVRCAEGEPVRSRIPRRLVATDPDRERVLELLVDARLVTSDGDVVEIAHEALARAWPRLVGWLDDDRDGQRIFHHLSLAADTWDAMGRPEAELYRGLRLERALEWCGRVAPDLHPVEREFLDAGRRHADAGGRAARRRRRIVTLALVAGLAVATTLTTVAIVNQRRADQEAGRANAAAERADREADRARAAALATAAISTLDEDPGLAKLLAVASATVAPPTSASTSALHQAWAADRVIARHTVDALAYQSTDLDPAGRRMAVAGAFPVNGSGKFLEVVDLAEDVIVWQTDVSDPSAWIASPLFTADGRNVVAGVYWDPLNPDRSPPLEPAAVDEPVEGVVGARLMNADTGEVVERYDLGRCGGLVTAVTDMYLLVRTLHGSPEVIAACDWAQGTIGTELVDRRSGNRRLLAANSGSGLCGAALSDDARRVAYDDVAGNQVVVEEMSTGEVLLRADPASDPAVCDVRALSPDGSLLLVGDQPIQVWDVADGRPVASFSAHRGRSRHATFSPTGRTVFSTGADGTLREWEAATGAQLGADPGVGDGRVSTGGDALVLVSDAYSRSSLVDTRARGEVGAVDTCDGDVFADSLRVASGSAAFHGVCDGDSDGTTFIVDLDTTALRAALPGHQSAALGVSPTGSRFVRQEGNGMMHGPLVVRDLLTGDEIVELNGACTWDAASSTPPERQSGCAPYPQQPFVIGPTRLAWSPDGTMIAAATGTAVVVWNADSGSLLFADEPDATRVAVADMIFSPDSQVLLVASNDENVRVLSTTTWNVVDEVSGAYAIGLIGYASDGTKLLAAAQLMANASSSLHWFDVETQRVSPSQTEVHEGSLRAVAMSGDGALIATASSDGRVRIWDGPSLELVQEIPVEDSPVQGVAFVDDHHVAVTPQRGDLLVFTIDANELLDIVRDSLTRGFTASECARFALGEACPTLADLRRER